MTKNLFENIIDDDVIDNLNDDAAKIILEILEKAGY